MYFIVTGDVGIGYPYLQQPIQKERYSLTHQLGRNNFFGDYYILFNLKSEFCYIATNEVQAFALSKRFLVQTVFSQYPNMIMTEF